MERLEREMKTIMVMLDLYCKSEHGREKLCDDCTKLKNYAFFRLTQCPFQAEKPSCQNCVIQCFKPDMRDFMKKVIRKTGTRLLLKYPILAGMFVYDMFFRAPELPEREKKSVL